MVLAFEMMPSGLSMLGPLIPPWSTLNTSSYYDLPDLPGHLNTGGPKQYCAATRYGSGLAVHGSIAVVGAPTWVQQGRYPHFACLLPYGRGQEDTLCNDRQHHIGDSKPPSDSQEQFPFIGAVSLFHKRSQPSGPCLGMAADDAVTACWHNAGTLSIPNLTYKEMEATGLTSIMLQECTIPSLEYGFMVAIGGTFIASPALMSCGARSFGGFIMFIHHLNGSLIDYYGEWLFFSWSEPTRTLASEPRLDRLVYSTYRFVTNKDRDRWGDLSEQSHSLVISHFDPSGNTRLPQSLIRLLPRFAGHAGQVEEEEPAADPLANLVRPDPLYSNCTSPLPNPSLAVVTSINVRLRALWVHCVLVQM